MLRGRNTLLPSPVGQLSRYRCGRPRGTKGIRAYLDQIESYSGEKIQYLKKREGDNYAEVATKIVDNGYWEAYDVLTEDISLI
jgi:hypothetical protein